MSPTMQLHALHTPREMLNQEYGIQKKQVVKNEVSKWKGDSGCAFSTMCIHVPACV
jgi:hypothetical protein